MRPAKPEAAPLYYAARLGLRDMVEYLLTKHLDVNAKGWLPSDPTACSVAWITSRSFMVTLSACHGCE